MIKVHHNRMSFSGRYQCSFFAYKYLFVFFQFHFYLKFASNIQSERIKYNKRAAVFFSNNWLKISDRISFCSSFLSIIRENNSKFGIFSNIYLISFAKLSTSLGEWLTLLSKLDQNQKFHISYWCRWPKVLLARFTNCGQSSQQTQMLKKFLHINQNQQWKFEYRP